MFQVFQVFQLHPPVGRKDCRMATDLNNVVLTGILERDPITRFADHGRQQ